VNKRNNEANNLYARLLCLWSKEDPVDINMKLENICQQLDTKPQVSWFFDRLFFKFVDVEYVK